MNSDELAEPVQGKTVSTLKEYTHEFGIALCGSFICIDNGAYYNRAFFITPNGEEHYYDKRHLFRMGDEQSHFSAGTKQVIIPFNGWNISLFVCYDLRFPVWSRNVDNTCDLAIYVANWPEPRRKVWDILLQARAIENQCYVCGVNRVGTDGNHLKYNGGSAVYSAKGEKTAFVPDNQATHITTTLDLDSLKVFRQKFPVWMDADTFTIQI